MNNYALSPLIGNLTMMTSQNWQIDICLVENCLSYNISKSGRKLITGKRDTKQRKILPLTFICITKMASYQLDVWCDLIVWSHSICIKNLGSIGPMVCEMQNKGNVCVGVCACVCVCVILYTKTAVARNAVVTPLCKAVWYEQREHNTQIWKIMHCRL